MKVRIILDLADRDIFLLRQMARLQRRSVSNYVTGEIIRLVEEDRKRTADDLEKAAPVPVSYDAIADKYAPRTAVGVTPPKWGTK